MSCSACQQRHVLISELRSKVPLRRALMLSILTVLSMLPCMPAWPAQLPQLVTPNWAQVSTYRDVKSYVDRSTADLTATIPDLKGLQPVANKAEGMKTLKPLLDRVGKNVQEFYSKFPDTTSLEHITMQKFGPNGKIISSRHEVFRYLAIAPPGRGVSTLLEYRTNQAGKRVESAGLEYGYAVTSGFASTAIYLHPVLQPDSSFRFLGTQKLDGKETDVIAFAQRPAWADLTLQFNTGRKTINLLVQGLAWVDPGSYQIVRMRTDLLAPSPETGLMGETTVVNFMEVQFPQMPGTILWLPRKVTVSIKSAARVPVKRTFDLPGGEGPVTATDYVWAYETYRDIHRYSDYRLFTSKSTLKY